MFKLISTLLIVLINCNYLNAFTFETGQTYKFKNTYTYNGVSLTVDYTVKIKSFDELFFQIHKFETLKSKKKFMYKMKFDEEFTMKKNNNQWLYEGGKSSTPREQSSSGQIASLTIPLILFNLHKSLFYTGLGLQNKNKLRISRPKKVICNWENSFNEFNQISYSPKDSDEITYSFLSISANTNKIEQGNYELLTTQALDKFKTGNLSHDNVYESPCNLNYYTTLLIK